MIFKCKPKHINNIDELKTQFEKEHDLSFFSHGHFNSLIEYQKQLIIKYLNPAKKDTLLDLACGHGYQLASIAPLIKMGTGVDWSSTMINYATKRNCHPNLKFHILDFNMLYELPELYDSVMCIGAFEHFTNHKLCCENVFKKLKKNGKFMIMTQNGSALWHQLASFFPQGLKHNSTDTFFKSKQLKELLSVTGFTSISIHYWNFIPTGDINPPFDALFNHAQQYIGHISPRIFKGGLIAIASK